MMKQKNSNLKQKKGIHGNTVNEVITQVGE